MSKVMSNVTGVELNTFDVGWQATSVVAFATSAGMIYLGLGIALQTILFLVKWTNIFQPSDLWNNYSYIVWGAISNLQDSQLCIRYRMYGFIKLIQLINFRTCSKTLV